MTILLVSLQPLLSALFADLQLEGLAVELTEENSKSYADLLFFLHSEELESFS